MIIALVKERYAGAAKNIQQAMNSTFMLFGNKSLKHSTVSQIRKKADLFFGNCTNLPVFKARVKGKTKTSEIPITC